jgi:SAM-dependent methyltransferase
MPEYALEISDAEIGRYQMMARSAVADEAAQLAAAGVVAGATVADIGCGPAALSIEIARLVGPSGRVIGVDSDPAALAAARGLIRQAGAANVSVQAGEAAGTGLRPGSADVVMMRHVLAHNGGREQAIVDHLATLARPGGSVYLADADGTAFRILGAGPDIDDMMARYLEFHRSRGSDLTVGLRLAALLETAGLRVTSFRGAYTIVTAPPGMRPPAWAARKQMLAAGIIDEQVLRRWEAALSQLDASPARPTLFAPLFTAIAQRTT